MPYALPDDQSVAPVPALRRRSVRGCVVALATAGVLSVTSASAFAQAPASGGAAPGSTPAPTTPAPTTTAPAQPAPAATAPTSKKAQVKAVQAKLGLKADGVTGSKTKSAIKRFQKRSGLKADGKVGPATLKALGIPTQTTAAPAPAGDQAAQLQAIAQCESGGNPTAVSADGRYHGKYQFDQATWERMGGTGDPAAAPEAEQDQRAAALMAAQGPSAWPNCAQGQQSSVKKKTKR